MTVAGAIRPPLRRPEACHARRAMGVARKRRVLAGMSGGVDSSAAAALLLDQGFDVVGVTLKLWPQDCVSRAEDKCCGPQAVMDARSVCARLGIPYYLIDESGLFQRKVIDYFAEEYRAGRTPNPCVMCNQHLKFGVLLDRARQLGCDAIATGHFARLERAADGRTLLKAGADARKDQSYFLFSLRQDQLSKALFPLGDLSKADTRSVARACSLPTADKEESMEICFVPDNDYGGFLKKAGLASAHRGDVVDSGGRKLGEHDGVEFYTVGQRRGLGIAAERPLYVVSVDADRNRVVLGGEEELMRREFSLQNCNWIPWEEPPREFRAAARIRHRHAGVAGVVRPGAGGTATVLLDVPARAVTPGQACVLYDGDLVLGGGWITR